MSNMRNLLNLVEESTKQSNEITKIIMSGNLSKFNTNVFSKYGLAIGSLQGVDGDYIAMYDYTFSSEVTVYDSVMSRQASREEPAEYDEVENLVDVDDDGILTINAEDDTISLSFDGKKVYTEKDDIEKTPKEFAGAILDCITDMEERLEEFHQKSDGETFSSEQDFKKSNMDI